MGDQGTYLSGYPPRAAPNMFAISSRASRSTDVQQRRRPASEQLEPQPQATDPVAAMTAAKLRRTTAGNVSGNRRQKNTGVISLCDLSPARWARRSCMTAAVSRDIRGLTKDACGWKALATPGDDNFKRTETTVKNMSDSAGRGPVVLLLSLCWFVMNVSPDLLAVASFWPPRPG